MKKQDLASLFSSILVIIIGLLIGFVILLISNFENAPTAFLNILTFGVRSMRNVGDVLLFATPIIMTGLSVAFAFKTGLFNIGATGQFTFGAFVAIYVSVEFTFLGYSLRLLIALILASLAGAIWGMIPGLLKAYRNVHEVISCIMTNYIGMFLVNWMILNSIFDQGRGTTLPVPSNANLPSLGLDNLFRDNIRGSNVNLGIILAILSAILVYVILEKTKLGYELKACGLNKNAAKYAGINENKNIVLSMAIAGALSGLGGAFGFLSGTGLSMSIVDALQTEGFVGISVAFLGLNNPISIIFSGIFVSYLFLGGTSVQVFGFSVQIIEMVISIIIYFCAFVFLVKKFLLDKLYKKEA